MYKKLVFASSLAVLLAACGGGGDSNPVTPPPVDPKVVVQGEINTVLSEISAKLASFATLDQAQPYFDETFLHDSMNLDGWVADMLNTEDDSYKETFLGSTWKDAQVVTLAEDGTRAKVKFTVAYANGFIPRIHTMEFVKDDGKWLAVGNQALAEVRLLATHELMDKPMATEDVLQLPRLTSEVGNWEGTEYTYYRQALPEAGQTEFPGATGWLAREGDTFENWGRMIWTGEEYDSPWTAYDDRLLRHKYTQNISTPNARVKSYLRLGVHWENYDERIVFVTLKGPGLPVEGLEFARDLSIFRLTGGGFDDIYSVEKCMAMPEEVRPGNCELDWSVMKKGAVYTYEFFDQNKTKLGQTEYELPVDMIAGDALLAKKSEYFTMLVTTPTGSAGSTPELSIANVFNDASGPFLPGTSVPLVFQQPTGQKAVFFRYEAGVEACEPGRTSCSGETGGMLVSGNSAKVYGTTNSVEPFLVIPETWPKIKWISIVTYSFDSGGNQYIQMSSPKNPK